MEEVLSELIPIKNNIFSGVKKIYLVGIGGVGMSNLALLLKDKGFKIVGSDIKDSPIIQMLKKQGIKVFIGHKEKQITSDIDLLGFSSAIKKDNPELIQAKELGISILRRGKLLAHICDDKKTVAVAGSHGKTTTTSLLGYLFSCLGYKPTVFIGGLPLNYSRGAWLGSDYFVVETDESDGTFLELKPFASLITNIDYEHLDYYGDLDNLKKSFLNFALQTKGKVFGWGDNPFVSEIINQVKGFSFGWQKNNLIRASNVKLNGKFSCFDLYIKDKFAVSIKIPLLGEHNCLNALAVLAFFYYLGEDLRKVNELLAGFKGVKRRFQIKERVKGVTFVDDYAHHPTEIKATLKAARFLNPERLIAIIQPHRFSRVKLLKSEFSRCFGQADKIIITDTYSASEKEIEGATAMDLFIQTKKHFLQKVEYIPKDLLAEEVPLRLRKGDLVVALGAGDINILMQKVIYEFKKDRIKAQR